MVKIFASKKGQAALEYMITYSWAFLVIIASVGALSYFGILSPSKYIPESCNFGEQLKCVDYYMDDSGVIVIRFLNNFEEDINLTNMKGPTLAEPMSITSLESGEITKVRINTSEAFPLGDKKEVEMTFFFQRDAAGAPEHAISGRLFAEVSDSELGLI